MNKQTWITLSSLGMSIPALIAADYTVASKRIEDVIELSATAIPQQGEKVSITPKRWQSFPIEKVVPHGTKVKKGDTLMLVEAMKTFNPITAPKSGKAELLAFYEMATRGGTTLEKTGPTQIADRSAAFAFKVHVKGISADDKAIDVDLPTGAMTIDVIDVFDFDEAGKIEQMRAYWGPSNISQ